MLGGGLPGAESVGQNWKGKCTIDGDWRGIIAISIVSKSDEYVFFYELYVIEVARESGT